MLNRAPIFVNGFQRGGTNILMNLLASHPGVGLLSGETHQVFWGKPDEKMMKWVHRAFYFPVVATARRHIFEPNALFERSDLPRPVLRYIDAIFYFSKINARANRMQKNGTPALTRSEIARTRLLCKNINGLTFATPLFASMYPDAKFIALVRNGLALCEGFMRRGWSAQNFGMMYNKICERMIHDSQTMPNYKIVRFEDILGDHMRLIREIYDHVGLDISTVSHFQLQAKPSMDRDGKRKYTFGGEKNRERHWFTMDQLSQCFRRDVNENQIAQLPANDRDAFLKEAGKSMEYLQYC